MVRVSRFVYLGAAWLFVAGVAAQVFLAGMVVVAGRMGWDAHRGLGHTLAAPLLFMLVSMYLGRLPGSLKRLTWVLFGAYILQADVVLLLRAGAPAVSALHPVFALVDFALGLALARRALPLTRRVQAPPALRPEFGTSTTRSMGDSR